MNWISVKDRLPENINYVFIYCPGLDIDKDLIIGWYSEKYCKGWFMKGHSSPTLKEKLKKVSHWMEFPEPPFQ